MGPPAEEASGEKGGDGEKTRARKKMYRPNKWCAEVGGVKQPCWCGEEWKDYHEDGNHGPVWVEVGK